MPLRVRVDAVCFKRYFKFLTRAKLKGTRRDFGTPLNQIPRSTF